MIFTLMGGYTVYPPLGINITPIRTRYDKFFQLFPLTASSRRTFDKSYDHIEYFGELGQRTHTGT